MQSKYPLLFKVIIALCISGNSYAEQEGNSLKVALSANTSLLVEQDKFSGQLGDFHNCLFINVPAKTIITYPNPDRIIKMLAGNGVDIGLLLVETDLRKDLADYLVSYLKVEVVKVSHINSATERVGIRTNAHVKQLFGNINDSSINYASTTEQLVNMFNKQNLDTIIEARALVEQYLDNLETYKVESKFVDIGLYASNTFKQRYPELSEELISRAISCQETLPEEFRL